MEVTSLSSSSYAKEYSSQQPLKTERSPSQDRDSLAVDTSSRQAEHESRIKGREWSVEELDDAIEAMNDLASIRSTSLKFEAHEKLNRLIVTVVDAATEEVVKEIPAKEFLDMISSMLEFAGILVDERA